MLPFKSHLCVNSRFLKKSNGSYFRHLNRTQRSNSFGEALREETQPTKTSLFIYTIFGGPNK
jgi:hypothetical protein